ncbi:phenylacetic acid degradation operon negative regulatory protein PaaX [Shouchella lonarensis]|uniref:Transcriptional regulator, PaaX family n=1 Tax=Shouchella lonarensis TaxID=1464122 RepID=A0A1G6H9G7_9BACI|nr:phenylacetic acid degradation operon negative regulatory protein PaaX [Shouchella lonarensis]SDB90794.1 transcriptional regulator, PaaX family [Shouchella lonarensis]
METNTRALIFTIYGDYIRHYGNQIWIGSLIRLLQQFGHHEQAVRVAISRMVKQGWLKSNKDGTKSYYSLTSRGVARIDEAAKRIFKFEQYQWDGKWRLFMHQIPTSARQVRETLKQELLWSGFGQFASGCFISPHCLDEQVDALIEKYEVAHEVDYFEAVYKGTRTNEALVAQSWSLATINEKYTQFMDGYGVLFRQHEQALRTGKLDAAACFVARTKLVHEYRKFLFIDPGLPQQLRPPRWQGHEAMQLFRRYYELLAVPASQFFESIFAEDNDLARKTTTYDARDHPLIAREAREWSGKEEGKQ